MAVKLKFDTGAGYSVDYWRIMAISFNLVEGKVKAAIGAYISKAKRDEGMKHALVFNREFTIPELNLDGNLREQIYTLLMKDPQFAEGKKV